MTEQQVQISNSLGIHARPASKIVQAATKFKSEIRLISADSQADAKSILNVMMLGANYGTRLRVRATGADEKEAVAAVVELIQNKFFEE
jgi:phosphocarrier protein HPr